MLNNRLSILMQQRAQWLSAKTQLTVENIANADMKSARRKEITPFLSILNRSQHARTNTGKLLTDVKNFKIKSEDSVTTKDEISREQEMMLLTRATTDHDGLMSIIKKFHQMYRTILAKS
jgi:flagellar basal-body rod protein FlgB